MTKATFASGAFVTAIILLGVALVVRDFVLEQDVVPAAATPLVITPFTPAAELAGEEHRGFIYGRVTDVDGATHEGRLRWRGDQEAFWGDYFNGAKDENPWAAHLPRASSPFEIFGVEIGGPGRPDLDRQFMARFGDIARVEAHLQDVQVTLKSGAVFELNRNAAGDIDDGVRVWDGKGGVVDLDARRIRTIEFLPTARLADAPQRLHGTVRTRVGDFTGFIQWNQQDGAGADELDGRADGREHRLRYDAIRSIARHSRESARVTLLDGREMVLSDTGEVGRENRGLYVDDGRYGRVLISWDAFERVDFSPGGSGPAYSDFPPGRPLAGTVTVRDGRRLAGRLVYDFDESQTTETMDALSEGVDYNIPFGLITSIVPGREGRGAQHATVKLHDGEELQFQRTGDLADRNAGLLIFVDGRDRPEYVPWTDVELVDFDPERSSAR
jgi:hypothetical protein